MKTIERAKEFYGNAPDGYPEWDDLRGIEQVVYLAQCIQEGKIAECDFPIKPGDFLYQGAVWCDEEADPKTGYCDEHWNEITTQWRD